MKPIIIFGTGEISELAHFYFCHDSSYQVEAFTVHNDFIDRANFQGLPVVAYEDIISQYPPEKFDMFIALSYAQMNTVREKIYNDAKRKGYHLVSYISKRATIWPGLEHGDNCFILEDNTIQPFVKIGNNVTLWSGNHIGHHSQVGDHIFIASHVVVSGGVTIENNCFIGVNVTLRDHITIAEKSLLGAGTLIVKDTIANGVYKGMPAKLAKITSDQLEKI